MFLFLFIAFVCIQGKGDMRTFWLTGIKSETTSTATTPVRLTEKESRDGGVGISLNNLSPLTTMTDSIRLTNQTPKFVDKKLFDLIEALPKNNQDE